MQRTERFKRLKEPENKLISHLDGPHPKKQVVSAVQVNWPYGCLDVPRTLISPQLRPLQEQGY